MQADYYAILGVEPTVSADAIKSAYRRLAKKYHPDISREPDAHQRMKSLNLAYHVLSDPLARSRYDRRRAILEASARKAARAARKGKKRAKAKTRPHSRASTAARTGPATPPPRPRRADEDADVSDELVARAAGLATRTRTLTIAYLQRRFDLSFAPAARLFEILIKRGVITRSGNWTEHKTEQSETAGAKTQTAR